MVVLQNLRLAKHSAFLQASCTLSAMSPKSEALSALPYLRGEQDRGKLASCCCTTHSPFDNCAASRLKMVSNYVIGMGLTALGCIVAPAIAILNQRTNSTSILQRSVLTVDSTNLYLAN